MSTLGNDIFVGGQGIDVGKTGAEIETRAVMFIHEGIHNTPGENTIDPENRLLGEGPGVKSHQTPYGGPPPPSFTRDLADDRDARPGTGDPRQLCLRRL